MEILYSIIIPHKDIPCLLQRCLDSIPPRDDVQIIVADDDSSPDVVDFAHFRAVTGRMWRFSLPKRAEEPVMPVIADLPEPKADGWYLRMPMISFCPAS